jgi:hypothetical protein
MTMTTLHYAKQALSHARFLSEQIGPRGAATPEEHRAAEYVQTQLKQSGLSDVRLESFRAPRSGWRPLTVVFSLALWGTILCWGNFYLTRVPAIGALIGVVLCAISLWLLYRIATRRNHFLSRRLATATSHNAVGRIVAANKDTQHVVLVANLDTYPDNWVVRTPRRTRVFYGMLRGVALSLVVSIGLFILGALEAWPFAFVAGGVCSMVQGLGLLLTLQADRGDFSPGANDNASGVGTLLALAERLRVEPLTHTAVWIVCAGSHTVDGSGLRWFMRHHPDLVHTAWFIGCERAGRGDRVAVVKREGWLPRSIRAEVRDLIARATADRVELRPRPISIARTTPIGPATWQGCRSLCVEMEEDRPATRLGDVSDRLTTTALNEVHQFVWTLLKTLDAG